MKQMVLPSTKRTGRVKAAILFGAGVVACGLPATAQQAENFKPTDLPNPYHLVKDWPTLPASMNGGHWGEVSRVHVDHDGNVWVLHRGFAVELPGSAVCLGPFAKYPPLLEFDPSGKLLAGLGTGLMAYPPGLTVDDAGNPWVTDVNDQATVLGMSTANAEGVTMGQEVLKLSPTGQFLPTLGKEGVSGDGPDTFDRPAGVAVEPDGDVFVADGHYPNAHHTARIVKFDKDGHFLKSWGHLGPEPGNFDEAHNLCVGGSQERLYVADRRNKRIPGVRPGRQPPCRLVPVRRGELRIRQPGRHRPRGDGLSRSDYAGTDDLDPLKTRGLIRGIIVGSAKDGSLKAFVPDPVDPSKIVRWSSASGIAADEHGDIYAADVGAHDMRKYERLDHP